MNCYRLSYGKLNIQKLIESVKSNCLNTKEKHPALFYKHRNDEVIFARRCFPATKTEKMP